MKHDSTEEVKHHKLQSEISSITCAWRLETANDAKRQAQNARLTDGGRAALLLSSNSLTHSVCLSPRASTATRACERLTSHAAQHVTAAEH